MADLTILLEDKGGSEKTKGSISGLLSSFVKGNVISDLILQSVKKTANLLEGIPMITSIFKIFKLILTLLFLPLIPILKPVLIALGQLAKKLAMAASGGAGFGEMITLLFEEGKKILGPVLEKLWEDLKDPLMKGFTTFIEEFIQIIIPILVSGFIQFTFELFKNIPDILSAAWKGLLEGLKTVWEDIKSNTGTYVLVFIGVLLVGLVAGILIALGVAVGGWAIALSLALVGLIVLVAKWLAERIPIWFDKLKEFGTWIWNTLVSIFTTAFEVIKGIGSWIWNKITSFFGGGEDEGHQLGLAYVPAQGMYKLHKGERVLSATERGKQSSGGMTLNINIDSPTFRNQDDIKLLVREIENRIKSEMRRRVSYA